MGTPGLPKGLHFGTVLETFGARLGAWADIWEAKGEFFGDLLPSKTIHNFNEKSAPGGVSKKRVGGMRACALGTRPNVTF